MPRRAAGLNKNLTFAGGVKHIKKFGNVFKAAAGRQFSGVSEYFKKAVAPGEGRRSEATG
jgi:hypothetical protein